MPTPDMAEDVRFMCMTLRTEALKRDTTGLGGFAMGVWPFVPASAMAFSSMNETELAGGVERGLGAGSGGGMSCSALSLVPFGSSVSSGGLVGGLRRR